MNFFPACGLVQFFSLSFLFSHLCVCVGENRSALFFLFFSEVKKRKKKVAA